MRKFQNYMIFLLFSNIVWLYKGQYAPHCYETNTKGRKGSDAS